MWSSEQFQCVTAIWCVKDRGSSWCDCNLNLKNDFGATGSDGPEKLYEGPCGVIHIQACLHF